MVEVGMIDSSCYMHSVLITGLSSCQNNGILVNYKNKFSIHVIQYNFELTSH